MQGRITISRPHGGNECIDIEIEDAVSGVLFLSVEVGYADFTKALTGHGYIPCEFETRGLDLIGKRRENKTELVYVFNGSHSSWRARAAAAIREHEKNGWIGRVEDAMNHHRCKSRDITGEWYEVTFVRHIERDAQGERK